MQRYDVEPDLLSGSWTISWSTVTSEGKLASTVLRVVSDDPPQSPR